MQFPFKDAAKCRLTCEYGRLGKSWKSGKHDGVDLVSTGDKTILAVADGKVIRSGWNDSWGEYIVIQMADARAIIYAHMVKNSRKVVVGQAVKAGQAIGTMGTTGHSTGAHLHIELQKRYYACGAVDDITKFLGIVNAVGGVKQVTTTINKVGNITGKEALEILVKKGVIDTPDYWLGQFKVVKNLENLFIKISQKMVN